MGDNGTPKPGFFDLKGHAKWNAWNELKGNKHHSKLIKVLCRYEQGGSNGQVCGTSQRTSSRDHKVRRVRRIQIVCTFKIKMLLSFVQKRFRMFKYNAALPRRRMPANALPRINAGVLPQNISTPPSILTLSRQSPK